MTREQELAEVLAELRMARRQRDDARDQAEALHVRLQRLAREAAEYRIAIASLNEELDSLRLRIVALEAAAS